jgi:hypothetical protein
MASLHGRQDCVVQFRLNLWGDPHGFHQGKIITKEMVGWWYTVSKSHELEMLKLDIYIYTYRIICMYNYVQLCTCIIYRERIIHISSYSYGFLCVLGLVMLCGMSPWNHQNMPSPQLPLLGSQLLGPRRSNDRNKWWNFQHPRHAAGILPPSGPGRWDGQPTVILENQIPKCYHAPNVDP